MSEATPGAAGAEGTPAPPAEGTPPAPPAEGTPPAEPGKTALTGADPEGSPPAKGGEGGEPAPPAGTPESYELNVPEGTISSELQTAAESRFKEIGLSNEQAQAVMDLRLQEQQQTAEAIDRQEAAWIDQVKADEQMGGANFQATLAAGRAVMSWFNDPELSAFLDSSRGGSHPAVIRAFLKVHSEISEGTLAANAQTPAPAEQSAAQKFYGQVDVAESAPAG